MRPSIKDHSGNKYIRRIYSAVERDSTGILIDVYQVISSFNVTCPAQQHALKKILCAGLRGKGETLKDLEEAIDALWRAIDREEQRLDIEGKDKQVDTLLPQTHR